MKHKRLFLRTLSVLAFFLMFGILTAHAEKKSWVKIDGTTMTFLYGEKEALAENEYLLNEGDNDPAWSDMAWNIMKVAFDASFKNARPTSCYRWFNHFIEITTIEGLENLNTSEVTTMSEMFSNCSNLVDLDLSHFDTSKVTNMRDMFGFCYLLQSLDLSKFNTSNVERHEWHV